MNLQKLKHPSHLEYLLLLTLTLLVSIGCNTARYGYRHDEVLPSIRTIQIRPIDVKIVSIHTGGIQEDRPDIVSEVSPRLIQEIQQVLAKKKVQIKTPGSNDQAEDVAEAEALARAINEAIYTHHYEFGEAQFIDYSLGDTAKKFGASDCDAVLLISLQAAVPTGGRVGLAVTAFLVSAVTGVQIYVSTNEILLEVMLVNTATGEVLWYNRRFQKSDVRSKGSMHSLVKDACNYLLVPLKKKRG